jgi:putative PIN family toxin of toxin-antitoxin system
VRILLDANLLIRAAITPSGAAREILRLIETNEAHVLVISMHLLAEVADVLRRDRIRERWPMGDDEVDAFCRHLAAIAEEVSPQPLRPIVIDPNDQAIIEAAISGGVNVICTLDRHFYDQRVLDFCASRGVQIMDDRDLLRMLRSKA